MSEDETVTDYMVKAETSVTSLSTANELISASLLIAMVLKNLPQEFKMFHAVIGQNTLKFSQFKLELRAFEESEKSCATQDRGESVMKTKDRHDNPNVKCYSCGKLGHMSYNSRSKKRQKISKQEGVRSVENLTIMRHVPQQQKRLQARKFLKILLKKTMNFVYLLIQGSVN